MINKKLYIKAIIEWGEAAQVRMAIEECSELITVLAKQGRNRNGSTTDDVLGEMADVEIMLEQLKIIFDYESSILNTSTFKQKKEAKLARLEKRLNAI